jgi:hypothetical protein
MTAAVLVRQRLRRPSGVAAAERPLTPVTRKRRRHRRQAMEAFCFGNVEKHTGRLEADGRYDDETRENLDEAGGSSFAQDAKTAGLGVTDADEAAAAGMEAPAVDPQWVNSAEQEPIAADGPDRGSGHRQHRWRARYCGAGQASMKTRTARIMTRSIVMSTVVSMSTGLLKIITRDTGSLAPCALSGRSQCDSHREGPRPRRRTNETL